MVDRQRDFWMRETGTGRQVAQLHERLMMMMMIKIHIKTAPTCFGLTTILMVHITDIS